MKKVLKKFLKGLVKFFIGFFCLILYRVKTVGIENVPSEGSIIFCGNHKSYLDPVMIVIKTKRYLRFMGKEELKKNPLFRYVFYLFDVIYVKRNSKDITPLKEAIKTLKNGDCIGIFPEGTRNGLEKNNGKLKDGAAYMAIKTGAMIIPIGIVGDWKPFHKVTLYYGKPIDVSKYQTKDKDEEKQNIEKVTSIIKEEIIKLTSSPN